MEQLKDFFTNYLLLCAFFSWLLAQILKIFTGVFSETKLNLKKLLFSSGGMPSSHSAAVVSLCTASILKFGAASSEFAISLIFALIVMIDASGVRYETGEQAKIINKITKELFSGRPEDINTGLKELVGHTPFQVIMGALLGLIVATLMGFIMNII